MALYAEDRIRDLEESNEELHGEVRELTKVVDAQAFDLKDTEKELDGLSEAITSAIADLRVLGEVPLGDLEEAIKAIADKLADRNGELY
jgi:predicted  nucleic acid-binding Zn-ribbon protein